MSQMEKKAGLLRRTSSSKKPLKEKVVLMYDEIFAKEDPAKKNPRFWDELFLMKVNLEYLESKLESVDGEEVQRIQDNINSLFHHCVQALGEEHQIKVVNALQTLCALFRGVHQKNKSASGFDIINMLMGFDKAEQRMKDLMERLDSLLCGDGSESLKSLCLKLLLCLVTVTDNISQNTILEYVMINSIFEAILQILSDVSSRGQHGYDAVVLLALLVNYRKYESVNPYIVKLSIVDDEPTLDGMGMVVHQALTEYNRQYKDKEEEHQGGFFSTLTSMVGNMFIADADEKLSVQTNEAILLALYEAVHLNRNFITVLAQSHPEIDIAATPTIPSPTTPTTPLGTTPPSLDNLMVEFIVTHMMKDFPMDLYLRCVQIIHKLLCYQKKCRIRLQYTWRELWSEPIFSVCFSALATFLFELNLFNMFITYGDTFLPTSNSYDELYYEIVRMHQVFDNLYCMVLRVSTNTGQWKEAASKVTHALVNVRAIINHFNPKIESYAAVNHISQLSEEQVLEVVRSNYDTLTLKLQDGLDQFERYSEQPKEAAFFKELVRSISLNVRKNVSLNTLSQDVLLKEFSTIS
uniref:Armadillo-like helical domain-containing protein n=1 Tax=Anabas testudineus TaxID=64144 RepID=A0A7N6AF44_ANATE